MNTLPIVTLKPKFHRGKHCVALMFPYNQELIKRARLLPHALWSASLKFWYVPYDDMVIPNIERLFKDYAKIINHIDFSLINKTKHSKRVRTINESHRSVLKGYQEYLKGKRYSASTVNTYLILIADLVEFYNEEDLKSLTNRSVEIFIEQIVAPKGYSISTHRQFISALKLFKLYYTDCNIDEFQLQMPKKDRKLPRFYHNPK